MNRKYVGTNFDDFLREEGLYEECKAGALKKVLALQVAERMKRLRFTRTKLASRLGTSRAAVNRILDPANESMTLQTISRVASALRMDLEIRLSARRTRRERRASGQQDQARRG